ncbi:MAG: hypothetical protein ACRC7U_07655, partial [Moraxella sp.]
MKLALSDWLISLALHSGLIGSVIVMGYLAQNLTQPRTKSESIRWIDVSAIQMRQNPKPIDNTKTAAATSPQAAAEQRLIKALPPPTAAVAKSQGRIQPPAAPKTALPKAAVSKPAQPRAATKFVQNQTVAKPPITQKTATVPTNNTTTKTPVINAVPAPAISTPTTTNNPAATNNSQNKDSQNKENTTKTDKPTQNTAPDTPTMAPDNAAQWKPRFVATVNRNKKYPMNAQKTGTQGSVLLTVTVSDSGTINCC